MINWWHAVDALKCCSTEDMLFWHPVTEMNFEVDERCISIKLPKILEADCLSQVFLLLSNLELLEESFQ